MVPRISISSALIDDLQRQTAASPIEICGLMFGTPDRIVAVEAVANVAADPARFFEVDPARLFAAHRSMRNGGPQLIGHYHSHPSGRAEPSNHDRAASVGDGALWLILTASDTKLWRSDAPGSLIPVVLDVMPSVE